MKIVFELIVEDKNLSAEIEKSKRQVKDLNQAFDQAKTGTAEYRRLAFELGEARGRLIDLKKQQREINRDFAATRVAADSLAGLRIEYAKLTEQVSKLTKAQRESTEGSALIKQAASLKKEINAIEESVGRFTGSVGNYQKALLSTFDIVSAGLITGGIERAVQLIADAVTAGVKAFSAYEVSLDNLSALTGVAGADLEKFAAKAQELTKIKVGDFDIVNTAADILEAFKLVGGAQPELLKSADALAEVTKQAIILSKASGLDLDQSVEAVITTLGQFQLEAGDATRVANELAAGAKAGASEIPDTTAALKEFGTTAANVNVTTTESVALIQTLAEQQLKGAEAGTALRNILAKIASADVLPRQALETLKNAGVSTEILTNATLPLEVRLKELAKLSGDTSALVKVFGLENLNAAQILTQSVGRYEEFVTQIGNTNEAYKQAETNSGNLTTAYENLKKEGLNLVVSGFEDLEPVLAAVLNLFSSGLGIIGGFFSFLVQLPKFVSENKEAFIGLGIGLSILNAEMILASANSIRLAAVEKIRTAITIATTFAQNGLNAAMAANPIGLIITAVSLLTLGFKALYDRSETVRASIAGLGNVASEIFSIIKEAVGSFIQGFKDLSEGNFSKAFSSFGDAIVKSNPVGIALTQGKRLRQAFNKGFDDKLAQDKAEQSREASAEKEVKLQQKKAKEIAKINSAAASSADKDSESAAKRREQEIGQQIKRIGDLRKEVRRLDAETIKNEFDKKEIDLQNQRLEALEKVEEKRKELSQKIADQGGAQTDQDREELALISEQTASIVALYEQRGKEVEEARQKAAESQLEELKALSLEVEKITRDNAQRSVEIELKSSTFAFEQQKKTLEIERDERIRILEQQFAKREITEQDFRKKSIDVNEQYTVQILAIERKRADEVKKITEEVTAARVEAARVQLQTELFTIQSSLKADIDALKERAGTQGIDTSSEIEERRRLAAEKTAQAKQAFAEAERQAIEDNKAASLDALESIDEAQQEAHENNLERLEEEKQRRRELGDAALEVAGTIASAVFDIEKNRVEQQQKTAITALDKEYAAKKEKAKGNQVQLDKLDAEYNKKKEAIEKEAAKQRKSIAIKEALIAGALAVVKALPNYVLAAVVAIATAAQVAVINSQTFARGGIAKFKKEGFFGGKPHSKGGTKGRFEDGTEIEVEEDEYFVIINKRASRTLKRLSDLNVAYGGVSFEPGSAGDRGAPPGASIFTPPGHPRFAGGGSLSFAPQIALPGAAQGTQTTIIVQATAEFTDEQMDAIASRLADKTATATKSAIGEGLDDRDRRLERQNSLTQNREG